MEGLRFGHQLRWLKEQTSGQHSMRPVRLVKSCNGVFPFGAIEDLLDTWKCQFKHGCFTYDDTTVRFTSVVDAHFGKSSGRAYGVYIIRQRDTWGILYIGKGGTIGGDGQFKGQDVPGRLRNVRGDIGSDMWFRDLLHAMGPLVVEYLILEPPASPAYAEVVLLQAYLTEHQRLPMKNNCL